MGIPELEPKTQWLVILCPLRIPETQIGLGSTFLPFSVLGALDHPVPASELLETSLLPKQGQQDIAELDPVRATSP